MPSDEQWDDIKEKDEDVAKVAEIYNDSSAFTFIFAPAHGHSSYTLAFSPCRKVPCPTFPQLKADWLQLHANVT